MAIKLLLSQGLPHGTLFHATFVTLQILTVSKRSWKRISSHLSNFSCFVSLVVDILSFLCCAAIMFLELAHYKFWLLCYVMLSISVHSPTGQLDHVTLHLQKFSTCIYIYINNNTLRYVSYNVYTFNMFIYKYNLHNIFTLCFYLVHFIFKDTLNALWNFQTIFLYKQAAILNFFVSC